MEAFGNFIFWVIKIFLLLFGFGLLLGGGYCVVMPLVSSMGGYEMVSTVIGLVALLVGGITFWAALRIISKSNAEQVDKARASFAPAQKTGDE